MPTFHYKAVDQDGTVLQGTVRAEDGRAAARDLRKRGIVATHVSAEKPGRGPRWGPGPSKRRATLRFTEEVATLLSAEVNLPRALEIAAEVADSEADARSARAVLVAVRGGDTFADALALQPDRYSRLHVSMVRAGEAAGALKEVMARLAAFERDREDVRSSVASSLAYPALLALAGVGAGLVLLWYVVPSLAATFRGSGVEPPLGMQWLIGASLVLRQWWLPLLLVPAGGGAALLAWARTESGRMRLDSALLRAPWVGLAFRKAEAARFARSMATLLAASVPMIQALGIARSVLSNQAVETALARVPAAVKDGEGVARAIERSGAFPPLAGQLLAVGEETGRLDRMFDRLAAIYERQTREAVKRFTALLEPAVILILGCVIATMVVMTLLALSSIQRMGL